MAEVRLDRVRKVFGSEGDAVVALDGFDLALPAGTFTTLLGPSGCGKTSALDLIAGFTKPESGTVTVDGRAVERPGPDRGVVFQDLALFPWLRVDENIAFGLRALPAKEADKVKARTDELLEAVGLLLFRRRYPAELSGGMRQRVAIARVLALDPPVLLMDEPFGALDAQTRVLMQEFLVSLWERRPRTALFITHDLDEAVFLADRLCVMTARPGRIKETLTVDLPRPREASIMSSARFHELRDRARVLVREEALRSIQPLSGTKA
ncbi:MAG: ABC transporter ATP-binding protein [Chloroflexi bacterium]|nr:ABC transporter ATP-binding protein [Chloroflexota bacterium]